ncbi:hypothetical protein LQ327_33345 [Actinomycetospora endophytica]|uniref:Uncharacterized protein n=1 Tax=Actinomycetospora endophytica TaxID=2291215 RepID=A0ABS8PK14_9PSEU|nr:hypothetical protein [Actinomycetospora endophytica]MCD2198262.1 hypothetical protein [Actinomycetospora endophytica]
MDDSIFCTRPYGHSGPHASPPRGTWRRRAGWWSWLDDGFHPETDLRDPGQVWGWWRWPAPAPGDPTRSQRWWARAQRLGAAIVPLAVLAWLILGAAGRT